MHQEHQATGQHDPEVVDHEFYRFGRNGFSGFFSRRFFGRCFFSSRVFGGGGSGVGRVVLPRLRWCTEQQCQQQRDAVEWNETLHIFHPF